VVKREDGKEGGEDRKDERTDVKKVNTNHANRDKQSFKKKGIVDKMYRHLTKGRRRTYLCSCYIVRRGGNHKIALYSKEGLDKRESWCKG